MKYNVFISHSTKDAKAVKIIREHLERSGITCFVSDRNLHHVNEWQKQLSDNMDCSDMLLYVHTRNSNASSEVGREINYFESKCCRPVLVYRLDDEEYANDRSYYLQSINFIDSLQCASQGLEVLLQDVKLALEGKVTISHSKKKSALLPAIGMFVIAVLVVIGKTVLDSRIDRMKASEIAERRAQMEKYIALAEHYIDIQDSLDLVFPCIDHADSVRLSLPESETLEARISDARLRFFNSMQEIRQGYITSVEALAASLPYLKEDSVEAKEEISEYIIKHNLISKILGIKPDATMNSITEQLTITTVH